MPPLRGALRQGRLPGRVPREGLPVRLLLRGVGAAPTSAACRRSTRSRSTSTCSGRPSGAQAGFGAIRAMRQPLPMCKPRSRAPTRSRSDETGCINPEFGELPVGEPTFRVFAQIKNDWLKTTSSSALARSDERRLAVPADGARPREPDEAEQEQRAARRARARRRRRSQAQRNATPSPCSGPWPWCTGAGAGVRRQLEPDGREARGVDRGGAAALQLARSAP